MKSTVLLIDDDPIDIKPVQMLLKSWDMDVVTARSGEEALEKLAGQPVDLVVSDVCMPGMKGEDVVVALARSNPGLPVLLLSGKGDIKSAVKAMKLGAFDYVTKPPDEGEFRIAIDRALEYSRLRRENEFFRAELAAGGMYGERLIGRSPKMQEVFDLINRTARADSTVLITGETGTGKELVAQAIHFKSPRAGKPFIAFNCAAVNPNLAESELFGHEKGAFTGAVASRRGRFEEADGGTMFLDEIGETTPEFQAKLLRVLQEKEFERVGSGKKIRIDVRILASTNRDLGQEVKNSRFREDLFYRLNVIRIHMPPLRERREDIPALAAHFVEEYGRRYGAGNRTLARSALDYLSSLDWKGNVRELQHVVERAVVLSDRAELDVGDFKYRPGDVTGAADGTTLEAVLEKRTREYLVETLDRVGWRKQEAAAILGVDRVTLYRMLKKYSLDSEP